MRIERIGNATLYLDDCFQILTTLNKDDAIITDPPYGNSYKVNKGNRSRASSLNWSKLKKGDQTDPVWPELDDTQLFNPYPWLGFKEIIMWGGNHYAEHLPSASCWLVWDKKRHTKSDNFSDCELAYTNLPGPVRIFRHLWRGLVREGAENISKSKKYHPWQKPIALMDWCVSKTTCETIIDPYMGSGTTGVACVKLGRKFIGIEKNEAYFNIACERITAAHAQGELFR